MAISAILIGSISTGTIAFADDDDDDDDHDDENKTPKTLESECAKTNPTDFKGILCQAVLSIKDSIDTLETAVSDLQTSIADINNKLSGIQNNAGTTVIEQSDASKTGLEVKSAVSPNVPPFQGCREKQ